MREARAGVREAGAGVREARAGVREAGAGVCEAWCARGLVCARPGVRFERGALSSVSCQRNEIVCCLCHGLW